MSSSQQLQFDFDMALSQARRLEELAMEIERGVTRPMGHSMQELAAVWKGDNANAYLKKEETLKTHIGKTSDRLREIAAEIRSVAKRVYEMEQNAVRIAKTQ